MPSRYLIRRSFENTIYHVYNRGVEKRDIFLDEQDYKVFLNYLKEYLSPLPDPSEIIKKEIYVKDRIFKGVERQPNNYNGKVELLAYCLMPNHFHLLLRQNTSTDALREFLHSISLRYSMYFNKKYDRVGPLFQGKYKAIMVIDENYLLYLSRYIHRNPAEHFNNLSDAYSSYADYLEVRKTEWVNPGLILSYFNNEVLPDFKKINTYKSFVEDYKTDSSTILENLVIEDL